jgi:hypothetical protein
LNDDFHKWALARTDVWRAEMLEHRNKIVEGIQQAIEEKIKPIIDKQERYLKVLEQDVSALKLDREHEASAKTVGAIKNLQKNMSVSILGFDKRFEKLAQINKEQGLEIRQLCQRQDATDAHQVCNLIRMNVIDESLEELENKWISWEKGDLSQKPCYKNMEEKNIYLKRFKLASIFPSLVRGYRPTTS